MTNIPSPVHLSSAVARQGLHLVIALAMVLITLGMVPVSADAATSPTGAVAAAWPDAFTPSVSTTNVAFSDTNGDYTPTYMDIASGACNACAGTEPSVGMASDGTNVFFRMRLATSPADNTQGGLVGGLYQAQISSGGVARVTVGVDGRSPTADFVYLATSTSTTKVYTYPFDTSGGQTSTGLRITDTGDGTGQVFLDFQVPISEIATATGQVVKADTPVKVYFGTSTFVNGITGDLMIPGAVSVNTATVPTITLAPLKVTFDPNDGTTASNSQNVLYNSTATVPDDPTPPAGMLFKGWYTAATGGTKWNFATKVLSSRTLYAQYGEPVTVTFDANGGDYTPPAQTFLTGTKATAPAQNPTRDNYLFKGWYLSLSGSAVNFSTATFSADTTLTAQWFKVSNTVTFDSMGGTPVDPQVVPTQPSNGSHATKPSPDPTKPGNLFYAWATGSDIKGSGSLWDFPGFYINNDVTIYALYYPKTTFDSAGGTPVPTMFYTDFGADSETPPTPPTRAGYTFKDWVVTGSSTGLPYDFRRMTLNDIPLTARWIADARIQFNTDGGTPVPDKFVPAGQGAGGEPSPAPTKVGYTFNGWYTAAVGGNLFDFYNRYTGGDATAYARWTAKTYTLSYDTNGGSATPASATVTFDQPTSPSEPATPTRTGYTFDGWYTAATGGTKWDFISPYPNPANTTLYAQWTKILVNSVVSFDTHSGDFWSIPPADQTVVEGSQAVKPANPVRTGYDFNGWFTSATGGTAWDFNAPVTETMTLHAQWTQHLWTLTTDYNGDDNNTGLTTQVVGFSDAIPTPAVDPTKAGSTFDGWFYVFGPFQYPVEMLAWMPDADATIIARWVPAVYVTQFDSAGGSPVAGSTQLNGTPVTQPADPTKAGYTFDGWFTAPVGGTRWNFDTDVVTHNQTLFAHWTAVVVPVVTHTVSFDAAGGSSVPAQTVTDEGLVVEPADPARAGYIFAGWFTAPAGGVLVDFGTMTINSDTVIFAQWNTASASSHKVSFDPNGGGTVRAQIVPDGEKATKPAAPVRAGFVFAGWFTAGGARYDFDTVVTDEVTLVAHWRAATATTDGDPVPASQLPTGNKGENLPDTGAPFGRQMAPLGGLFLMLGGVLIARSRRREG